jgi:DNA-binding MarR family transcriptional regulator
MNMSLSQNDYEALAELRYLLRIFLRFSEEEAHKAGLTPQQQQALLAIKGFPGGSQRATIGELAERLQVRHHSAVGLVDRLVSQGLVDRIQDGADRRQVFVALTPSGEERLQDLSESHRDELSRIGHDIRAMLERLA